MRMDITTRQIRTALEELDPLFAAFSDFYMSSDGIAGPKLGSLSLLRVLNNAFQNCRFRHCGYCLCSMEQPGAPDRLSRT